MDLAFQDLGCMKEPAWKKEASTISSSGQDCAISHKYFSPPCLSKPTLECGGLGWDHTVEARAKKHPACLQGALGFWGFDGFALGSPTFPHQKCMDVLGSQGWVSGGGFPLEGLLL
eukprot:8793182-Pyramimonas_sp.AAC.1